MTPTGHAPAPDRGPLTSADLTRYADWYVDRFGGTSTHLRRALWRKVGRVEPDLTAARRGEVNAWIDEVMDRLTRAGLLDDARWASGKASRAIGRGVAPTQVAARLRAKGISEAGAREALQVAAAEGSVPLELRAAVAWARRRRVGPWRLEDDRSALRQKDLAAAARAGFSWSVATRVVDAPSVEALQALEAGEDLPPDRET